MKKINYYLLFICMVLFSCAANTSSGLEASNQINSKRSILSDEDAKECMQYSSWQADYWKEKNYRRCIYCNIYMKDLNCDLSEKRVNYYNLSRSFIELSAEKADSAFWALRAGMDVNGETEVLLELGAYIAKKINDVDDQLYYLEEVSELYPNNQRALEQLSTLYAKQERYDEQVEILDLWLDFEICSSV